MEWNYIASREDTNPIYLFGYEIASATVSTGTDSKEPVYKEIEGIKVFKSNDSFRFGNCATIAICQAFDISYNAFKVICMLMKIKNYSGLSFFECKKLINLLSSSCNCTSKYIPNVGKVSYAQMLLLLNKKKYLTMFDIHLSFAEYGEVFDSYFYSFNSEFREIPTGWWEINN